MLGRRDFITAQLASIDLNEKAGIIKAFLSEAGDQKPSVNVKQLSHRMLFDFRLQIFKVFSYICMIQIDNFICYLMLSFLKMFCDMSDIK